MWFVAIVMGHLFGDYMLQGKYIATNKTKKWQIAAIHSLIYSACVSFFLAVFGYVTNPLLVLVTMVFIFITHFPLDYLSFIPYKGAEHRETIPALWLRKIGGRNLADEIQAEEHPLKTTNIAFAAIVYTVVDNTMHFTLMLLFPLLWNWLK